MKRECLWGERLFLLNFKNVYLFFFGVNEMKDIKGILYVFNN